ncbi:hypothetical protein BDN72DRAFT_851664 [Pluteus cervinus]|uniref:Uncharacterized protein n=1 Tax=Pluteus cervinus TaxID=181527 RepID=A0ACD2ZYY2_9AGAR|nr:hypothetical protein BDN72DRAFT_851664 [Pluteus cervinus]
MVRRPSNDPNTAERQRIKKRLRKLYRRVNRLTARLNDLAPINRLPPELITRVFFFLQTDIETAGAAYYRWTDVTRVSRYWRNLALEAKFLWSGVNYTTVVPESRWAALSLEHSRPHHLDVVMEVTSIGPDFALTQAIVQDMSRIRSLQITLGLNMIPQAVDDAVGSCLAALTRSFGLDAPVLEDFSVHGNELSTAENSGYFPTPGIIFSSNAPNLTSIDIWHLYFPITSLPFPNLTELKVRYETPTPVLSFEMLFKVLRETRLNILKLFYSLFGEDYIREEDSAERIALPTLTQLDFRGSPSQCNFILTKVVVKPSCQITIKARTFDSEVLGGDPDPQGFIDEIISCIPQSLTNLNRIDVTISEDLDGVTLDLWRESQLKAGSFEIESAVQVSYWLPTTHENVDWLPFPSSLQLSKVWFVMLLCRAPSWTLPARNSVIDCVSKLPSLSHIILEDLFVDSLAVTLLAHPESFEKLGSLQIICDGQLPSCLEKLYNALVQRNNGGFRSLSRIDFDMGFPDDQGDEDAYKWKGLLMQLVDEYVRISPSSL